MPSTAGSKDIKPTVASQMPNGSAIANTTWRNRNGVGDGCMLYSTGVVGLMRYTFCARREMRNNSPAGVAAISTGVGTDAKG